ncbi:unnamed protein product [Eruca vesicaria subsp. sativa]|uniref:Uncharacterized protein n=1 Tax=Eruca vesicaria subsp. sativa TaxID=29727 RepID=A0ABC8LRU8_ERUVS|nr:unnamed protein product [Eruca vesicaria subsp. sativa]
MVGNRTHSSKRLSLFSFFTPRGSHVRVEADASWDDSVYTRKALASDEDKRYCVTCVAEPGIDRKASAFIAKFHATRVSESERQTLSPYQSEKAS